MVLKVPHASQTEKEKTMCDHSGNTDVTTACFSSRLLGFPKVLDAFFLDSDYCRSTDIDSLPQSGSCRRQTDHHDRPRRSKSKALDRV